MSHIPRNTLSASSLIDAVFKKFSEIPDPREFKKESSISLTDNLMSGLAIFGLKFPSLLQYDRHRKAPPIEANLKALYHVKNPPSDTYLRERLDPIDPTYLRPAFKTLFALLQRGKGLEGFEFFDGYYLLSLDGTGDFSSDKVCCKNCCQKTHSNGNVTYYHQMLGACIVHPGKSNVIPLCPEIISNIDGGTKNDCERNAAKRFIENFRREHPHLKVIIVEDGLASNGPHIRLLQENKMKYIIGAKRGDHEYLFEQVENSENATYHEIKDDKGTLHQFRFINAIALNKSSPDLQVNFIEYRETRSNGKELNFSWVTNIPVCENNIYHLMRGGRTRWKIENETFNTLKNLGYNFGHSYGHGKEYLASVFCMLTILSFLIDQIQEISCSLFRSMKKFIGSYRALWESMRVLLQHIEIGTWVRLYLLISRKETLNTLNSS